MSLENAILETLVYSDIFDYPLTIGELHRYLVAPAEQDDVLRCVAQMNKIDSHDGYYFLSGRYEIVHVRIQRESASRKVYKQAITYGRILGSLPFVRMVALTGSLAVMNLSSAADIDYMLVTQTGRLWTARAFAVTFARMMRPFGHTICVNLLVSEKVLTWPQQDLYPAREICQMIPITGIDVYQRLRAANLWTKTILPNSGMSAPNLLEVPSRNQPNQIQRLLESPLSGKHGDRLEEWTRKYQMQRTARRFGIGSETNFTEDVCQANFHNHRKLTDEFYNARLASLGLVEHAREMAEI
ncbi:MAG: hypothetical protein H7Y59_00515 [Anaerolineales bacterium]|nr:hypothetical protein [Anaerolineales bacterium]